MDKAAAALFALLALFWAGAAVLASCNGGPTVERASLGAHRTAPAGR